jgi:hypothetical protein
MRAAHSQIWRDGDVKNIHYLFEKPWTVKGQRSETHLWWWEMDNERQQKEKEMGLSEPEWP